MTPSRTLIAGLGLGLITAVLWGSWAVFSRAGLIGGLGFYDVAALRFGVAGTLLLPVILRRGVGRNGIAGVSWPVALILWLGAGVPFALLAFAGLAIAPASHQVVITPSCVLVFTALLGWLVLGERLGRAQLLGMAVVVAGIAAIGVEAIADTASGFGWGHLLFVSTGLLWAVFTVTARAWRVGALVATAVVSVLSLAYLPVYVAVFGGRLLSAPPSAVLFQAVFQGVLIGVVALILFMRAVALLGAGRAALFAAIVPVMGALLAVPILGERLSAPTLAGAVLVSLGMVLAIGRGAAGQGAAPRAKPPHRS